VNFFAATHTDALCCFASLLNFICICTALRILLSSYNSISNSTEVGLTDGRIGFDILQLVIGAFEPARCGSLTTDFEYTKLLFQTLQAVSLLSELAFAVRMGFHARPD
jgi:hypothetical protein